MASLATAGNVHQTCLRILRARGYALRIEIERYEDDDEPYGYSAERDGFSFAAEDPIALLGLVAVYEHVRPTSDEPYWWVVDGPDVHDELMGEALERAFAELRDRDRARWVQEVRQAVAHAETDPETSAADRLGVSLATLERALAELS